MANELNIPKYHLTMWEDTFKILSERIKKDRHASIGGKLSSKLKEDSPMLKDSKKAEADRKIALQKNFKSLLERYYKMGFYRECRDYNQKVEKPFQKFLKDVINPLFKKEYLGAKDIDGFCNAQNINKADLQNSYFNAYKDIDNVKYISDIKLTQKGTTVLSFDLTEKTNDFSKMELWSKDEYKDYDGICFAMIRTAQTTYINLKNAGTEIAKKTLAKLSEDNADLQTNIRKAKEARKDEKQKIKTFNEHLETLKKLKELLPIYIEKYGAVRHTFINDEFIKKLDNIIEYSAKIINFYDTYSKHLKNISRSSGNEKLLNKMDYFYIDKTDAKQNIDELQTICKRNNSKGPNEFCIKYKNTMEQMTGTMLKHLKELSTEFCNAQSSSKPKNPPNPTEYLKNLTTLYTETCKQVDQIIANTEKVHKYMANIRTTKLLTRLAYTKFILSIVLPFAKKPVDTILKAAGEVVAATQNITSSHLFDSKEVAQMHID